MSVRTFLCPLCIAVLLLVLQGCAGYHRQVRSTVDAMRHGAPEQALADLEAAYAGSKDKDLLYYLEKGELLRARGAYEDSLASWMAADERVRVWEEQARTDPARLLGQIGSVLFNDTTRRYEGRDYEKVLISLRLALNRLSLGDWAGARVEIKRMHEREAVIADFRAREVDEAADAARRKGLQVTSFRQLNGYPVETLDAPEVRALKNAYESAIANYVAGFVYEALNEPSLAAAGYRRALELNPDAAFLEEALAGLDGRVAGGAALAADAQAKHARPAPAIRTAAQRQTVDTLIIVESGMAPAIASRTLPIPLPIQGRHAVQWVLTPISWPVLLPAASQEIPESLSLGARTVPLTLVTSVDHMARRALADEMGGIMVRSSLRAIVKGAAQKAINDNVASMGPLGGLLALAATVATVATEQADERTWRTLPAFYSAARVSLTPGEHTLTLPTPAGPIVKTLRVDGRHAVIALRSTGRMVYLSQMPVSTPGSPPVPVTEMSSCPSPSPAAPCPPPLARPSGAPSRKEIAL